MESLGGAAGLVVWPHSSLLTLHSFYQPRNSETTSVDDCGMRVDDLQ